MKEIYEIRDKVSNGEMDSNEAFWQVLDLLAVMPSLPDDIVRSKEQNERMREWFKERTGLEDALLNEHMKKIDEMLKGNGA
jgi:hypothetical protein